MLGFRGLATFVSAVRVGFTGDWIGCPLTGAVPIDMAERTWTGDGGMIPGGKVAAGAKRAGIRNCCSPAGNEGKVDCFAAEKCGFVVADGDVIIWYGPARGVRPDPGDRKGPPAPDGRWLCGGNMLCSWI